MKTNVLLPIVAVVALIIGALAGWGVTAAIKAGEARQAAEQYAVLEAEFEELEEEYEAQLAAYMDAEKALEELKELKELGLIPSVQEATDLMSEATELSKSQTDMMQQLDESGVLDKLLEEASTE